LDESGPSDESRGPDLITAKYHHSHRIKIRGLRGKGEKPKGTSMVQENRTGSPLPIKRINTVFFFIFNLPPSL